MKNGGVTYQNQDSRDETDTETGDQATGNDETKTVAGSLKSDTNEEDGATKDDGQSTTNPVGKVTGNEGTEEGTGRQDRCDKRLVGGGHDGGVRALDDLDEVVHTVDTGDITGVVSEEDTTEGGKGAHHVGLHGNGSLHAGDITRTVGYSTTRHLD